MNWQTLSLALHLVALALWLGDVIFFLVVFAPALKDIEPETAFPVLDHGRKAFEAVAWIGITLLLISGMVKLTLRREAGAASLGQFYYIALSIKLMVFGAMVYHHALQVFKYGPQIAAMTANAPEDLILGSEALRDLWQKWFTLLKITATLGTIATLMGLVLLKS